MVIIEGPDGAGKTTLVNQLQERFPDLHEGRRGTRDRKKLYTVTVMDTFAALSHEVTSRKISRRGYYGPKIWDRLFFSEFVYWRYNKPEPRQCEFNEAQRQFVTELLAVMRVPIILCLPPVETVIANAEKADQMKGVNEHIRDIYIDYVNLYRFMPAQTVIYDYTIEGPERIFMIVEAYMTKRKDREWSHDLARG